MLKSFQMKLQSKCNRKGGKFNGKKDETKRRKTK